MASSLGSKRVTYCEHIAGNAEGKTVSAVYLLVRQAFHKGANMSSWIRKRVKRGKRQKRFQ